MANIKPIRSDRDYEAALGRISELMDAEPDSREGDELDILVDLVELYESKHVPMGYPNPIAAIEFRMEQAGLRPADLATFIGSRAKVSEVLSGKRAITMPMARALHEHLGIPADVLLREPDVDLDDPWADMEWSRFPVKSMAKLGWIPDRPDPAGRAEQVMRGLINRAGGLDVAGAALYRKNDHVRANAKMDPYALRAWCWQILARANEDLPKAGYERGTVTLDFLTKVARLSWSEDGPRLAKELLVKRGISLVIEKHLPKTYLDGVALRLGDGRPVIGLTLRYDRIDNFWFCLLHELAHVGRHMDNDRGEVFVDDFTLRKLEGRRGKPQGDAGRRMGGRSAYSALGLGSERSAGSADDHGCDESRQRPASASGDRRGEGSIRTEELSAVVAIRRDRRGAATVRHVVRQRADELP